MSQKKIVVIGAGVGGLTAAYRLQQAGMDVVIYDHMDYSGGRTKSVKRGEFTINVGAGLLPGSYKETVTLAEELGLGNDMVAVNGKCGFIRQGKIYPIDLGRMAVDMLTTGLISWPSKLRLTKLLAPLLRHYGDLNYHNLGEASALDKETVAEYCLRELDKQTLDYLFGPFIRTMYLQSPESASLAQLFWCMKNLSGAPFGFKSGMDALCLALAGQLDVRLRHKVLELQEQDDKVSLRLMDNDNTTSQIEADACVIATDGKALLSLYGDGLSEAQSNYLNNLEYCGDVVVTFCLSTLPATEMTLLQVPADEDEELAVLQVYREEGQGRAPNGKSMVTTHFLDSWAERMLDATDEEILADASSRASRFVPEIATHLEFAHIERWPRAATKSHVGIYHDLARFVADRKDTARVQYCGDYLSLSSVNTSVVTGEAVARSILKNVSM